jgi:glutaredoxin-like protein NrdH
MIGKKHVDGKSAGEIMLYALSTCGWCRKAKEILNKLGVAYDYINVDELSEAESAAVEEKEVKKYNSAATYPTLVINHQRAEIDFRAGKIAGLN